MEYNGWTNYETWKMNLNLTNEEGIYNGVLEVLESAEEKSEKAKALKEWVEQNFWVEEYNIVGFRGGDSFTPAELANINWLEIVEGFE